LYSRLATSLYGFLVEICKTVTLSGTIARLAPESAAARMCLEFGAVVVAYVLVRDLSTFAPERNDRRIEVIATGLPVWNGPEGHRHYLGFPPKKKRLGRPPASKLAIDGAVRRIVSSNCWPGTKLPRPASPPNTCRRGVDFPLGGHDSFRRHPPPPPQLYRHQQQWPLAQPSATSQTKPLTHLPQLHASSLGKRQHRLRTNSRETNQKKTQRVQHPSIGTGHRTSKMHWKHNFAQHRSQRHKINFKNQHKLCLIKACHGKGGG